MANVFNARPIIVDTVMVSDFLTTISATTSGRPLKIAKIEWNAPAASSSFVITDGSTGAAVLFQSNTPASFVGQDPQFDFASNPRPWRNFKVTVLGSGKLLIFTV